MPPNRPNSSAARTCRRKEVSPLELVDAAITCIEKVNPQLNAVITPLFDKARTQAQEARRSSLADGPFRGVPFLLKDLVCATGGDPIYGGMRLLRDARFVAAQSPLAKTWFADTAAAMILHRRSRSDAT